MRNKMKKKPMRASLYYYLCSDFIGSYKEWLKHRWNKEEKE